MQPPADFRNFRSLAGFVAALALLGIVVWLDWRYTVRMQYAASWVTHRHQVRDQLQRLLSQLPDIETGAADIARMDVMEENLLVKRVAKQTRRGQSEGGAAFPRAGRGQPEYEARPIAV